MNLVIDFYFILPLTCAIFVSLFGLFVLWQGRTMRMNQLLFGFCVSMFFWQFGTSMMFATRGDIASAVFWDRFVYFGVIFMPSFMHHFSLLFTKREGKQKILLFLNYAIACFFVIAATTPYFVDGLYYYSWGVHTQARILHTLFLVYFFISTGIFFVNLWTAYRKSKDKLFRSQTIFVFIAFATVIFIGGLAYLYAYNIDTKFPFSYVTGLIFPIMLFYTVSRHHFLGVRTVTAEVLVGVTEFLVVMQIFLSNNLRDIILRVAFAIAVGIIGVFLIKLIRKEVSSREEMANMAYSLEKANLRLQELDRQKTEFLSIASHQLRTPLSILKGYIELIEDGAYGKINREIVQVLHNIDFNNEQLIQLVDEFLDISRIEQGRTKYKFVNLDMNNVIEQVVTAVKNKAGIRKMKIIWKKNKGLKNILADEEKIGNVLMNYLDNAIKYSEKGNITVETKMEKGGLAVFVKDRGLGFEKSDKVNFFQKFYRGKNVDGIDVTGTGLGLYVCRRFVEAHQGVVWAHSKGLGEGSEFGFWIPYTKK